jgi:hypothetical protein
MDMAGGTSCDLALLFATSKHDQARLLRSVRSVVGPRARIAGGCAAGIITNDRLGYNGWQVGVAVVASSSLQIQTFLEGGLSQGEHRAGHALGQQIRAAADIDKTTLVLAYELVRATTPQGPALNMGTPFLQGMTEALGAWPPAVGLGLLGGIMWTPGFAFFDDRLEAQSAFAVAISGPVRMDFVHLHWLRPMTSYREITRVDGPAVLEIDGRPALEVLEELLGSDLRWEDYPLMVTLGVNRGDKFGEFREEDYANYLCVAVDRDRKALILSDTYLRPGMHVQLMRRQFDFPHIRRRVGELLEQVRDRRPFLALYIDCAGRASVFACTETEEAAEVQQTLGDRIPLLGLYTGSEIARVGGEMQRLNHAGILSIFSEPP